MPRYFLSKEVELYQYANSYYICSTLLDKSPIIGIPTRVLEERTYRALKQMHLAEMKSKALASDEIHALVGDDIDLETLVMDRILIAEKVQSAEDRVLQKFIRDHAARSPGQDTAARERFESLTQALSFAPNTFFNLPQEIADGATEVGLFGVPLATLKDNLGSLFGPDNLRAMTRGIHWLKRVQQGFYHELMMNGSGPGVLCRDVVLKDYGNITCENRTISEIFSQLADTLRTLREEWDVAPLFIGGDHAITFPIVDALAHRVDHLHVLHLDAHNDLFYNHELTFTHSAPISNLILSSPVEKILSFGLRTFHDDRVQNMEKICGNKRIADRLGLYSLLQTKQLLYRDELLRTLFETYRDFPFYLTIDLDVLSDSAIGNQVSTPLGDGLLWHELLSFLNIAFNQLTIIGCDITEFNALAGGSANRTSYYLTTLLLQVIDGLAKTRRRVGGAVEA